MIIEKNFFFYLMTKPKLVFSKLLSVLTLKLSISTEKNLLKQKCICFIHLKCDQYAYFVSLVMFRVIYTVVSQIR